MHLPKFYDPNNLGVLRAPDIQSAADFGASLRGAVNPAVKDNQLKTLLLLIDLQNDFVLPTGNLKVDGAVGDLQRTIEFIYGNLGGITKIMASLDTHQIYQIFHPAWWIDANGNNPAPFTPITLADIKQKLWQPVVDTVESSQYVEALEQQGKKTLMIWPYHCLADSPGHALVASLSEAIMVHTMARYSQPRIVSKGQLPNTEFYSIFEPEVKSGKAANQGINVQVLDEIAKYDIIYVAGQARSHCVLESMNSLLRYFGGRADVIRKIRFLDDCTSSIPGFETSTEQAIQGFVQQGVQLVNSTDPFGV